MEENDLECNEGGMMPNQQITLNSGKWGTICDDDFDENDAKVVCRMLLCRP